MSKVTARYHVSIPRALAERVGIRIGDELDWEAVDGELRLRPSAPSRLTLTIDERLRRFDDAIARQCAREEAAPRAHDSNRAWTRDDLYA